LLHAERQIVLDPVGDELRFGVLEDEADGAAEGTRTVDTGVESTHRHGAAEPAA
jgi:hypothetical protein